MLPERVRREREDGGDRAVPAGGRERRLYELGLLERLRERVAVGELAVKENVPVLDGHRSSPVLRLDGEHAGRPRDDMVDVLSAGDEVVEDVVRLRQARQDPGDALLAARALEEPLGVAKPLRKTPAGIDDRRGEQRKPPHDIGEHSRGDGESRDKYAEEERPEACHHALHPGPLARNSVYLGHI